MQLNTNLEQLKSREYKLILSTSEFTGTNKDLDRDKMTKILENYLLDSKLSLEKSKEKVKERTVWFLDNQNYELYRKNDFIIRVKEKQKENNELEYGITFKVRKLKIEDLNGIDLVTLNPELSHKVDEKKIEEDIMSDLSSKYSKSTELEIEDKLDLKTWEDVLVIFPKLGLDEIDDKRLVVVNGKKVKEISYNLGDILFEDEKKAEVGFSIWINQTADNEAKIGEFDIDIKVKDLNVKNGMDTHDVFGDQAVAEIDLLFKNLLNDPITNRRNMTKTEFIYSNGT